jgi:hypothetical protein
MSRKNHRFFSTQIKAKKELWKKENVFLETFDYQLFTAVFIKNHRLTKHLFFTSSRVEKKRSFFFDIIMFNRQVIDNVSCP